MQELITFVTVRAMSPPKKLNTLATFIQITPVAVDTSTGDLQANTVVRTQAYSTIEHVRAANAGEITAFPTATTTFIIMEKEGLNIRRRRIVTAMVYATVNTALTA